MAIMVRKLFKNAGSQYGMRLAAGKGGMNHLVQWVHTVEDEDVLGSLRGGEMVFTSGVQNQGGDGLLAFAKKLASAGVSAFAVCLGPRVPELPPALKAYCDSVSLPLFAIPRGTRVADMTRDFCHQIMLSEYAEQSIASAIQNILFKVGDAEAHALQLERCGWQRDSSFSFVAAGADGEIWQDAGLARIAEAAARRLREPFVSFSHKEARVMVLVNYDEDEIDVFIQDFLRIAKAELPGLTPRLGVSSTQQGILSQAMNFERSLAALQMARRRKEAVVYYDRLGFFKLLCAVEDKSVLRGLYQETVGRLEEHDRENRTELTGLLRACQEMNGNLIRIAEARNVHRNTVANQLKKIKAVTGLDPLEQKDMLLLMTGMRIRDML